MKRFLFLLISAASLLCAAAPVQASGQSINFQDSAQQKFAVTLPSGQLALIVALLPDRGRADVVNLSNQLAPAFVAYDSAKAVTCTVTYELVRYVYQTLGANQERIAADDNAILKGLLWVQIQNRPALLQAIAAIAMGNDQDRASLRQAGVDYIHKTQSGL